MPHPLTPALSPKGRGSDSFLHRLTWPLPALLTWAVAWAAFGGLHAIGAPPWLSLVSGTATGLLLSRGATTRWRRVFTGAGFPLSLAASGMAALPAWAWLLPLAALMALYPVRSWRDAPLFPTPTGALQGMALVAPLPAGALVLDAGCGLGAGLRELRRAYPQAELHGIEWSWPLRLACGWRCRFMRPPAIVERGDIWAADWRRYDMVYLFQRPESLPRAWAKAAAELAPGAWLASLEFEAAGPVPDAVHACPDGRRVWLYKAPLAGGSTVK